MDTVFPILSIVVPPVLASTLRSRIRAIFWGTIWIWFLMIAATQYHVAHDLEYDSIAPGLAIIVGWFLGLVYTSLCVLAVMIATAIFRWMATRRQVEKEEGDRFKD